MTDASDDYCIALATLHGPSTIADADGRIGPQDPFVFDAIGAPTPWWIRRDGLYYPNYATRAEAARAYCKHYKLI